MLSYSLASSLQEGPNPSRVEWGLLSGLSRKDFHTILQCAHTLHACSDLASLQERTLEILPGIVACDIVALTEVDVPGRHGIAIIKPSDFDLGQLMPLFQKHLHEHPVVMYHTRTGASDALAISDFLLRREYLRTGLYNEVYRQMGVEDQISLSLRPGGSLLVGLSLSRKRWGFKERDRGVLELLRPHLIQAYQNVALTDELRAHAAAAENVLEWLPDGVIELGNDGKVRRVTAMARKMIEHFFPDPRRGTCDLPEELLGWARAQTTNPDNSIAPAKSMAVQRELSRLVARIILSNANRCLILLTEQNPPGQREAAFTRLGLSSREGEVMNWVIEGKTSPEIGMILSISTRTVHKHLERLFLKLSVETRAAAIARITEDLSSII